MKHHRPPHGAKRPDPAKIAALPKAHAHPRIAAHLSGAVPLPKATNNRAKLVARKNQGQTSACTCHSISALAGTLAALVGIVCVDPSEHVLYSRSGRIETPTGDLQDDGRQLLDVWQAFQADGFAPQAGPTPDGRNSDVWSDADVSGLAPVPMANVNVDATADELAAAVTCRPPFMLANVDPAGGDVELQVQAALAAGHLVWSGTQVGQAFESLTGETDAQPDAIPNDPEGGGHALFFLDYRTRDDGTVEYLVVNSWGEEWGDAPTEPGLCWASGAFVRGCWELHAISVCP